MCGINGLIYFDANRVVDAQHLSAMRDVLRHRGPDDKGLFIHKNVGLAHRRLSILDTSSAGHQPLSTDDGRYTIVFNGEIYNFKDFYPELKSKGIEFHSQSDTEVLLHLYRLYGASMLSRLNGMFAFVIFDRDNGTLFIARDRMGVKPLFYCIHDHSLLFSSEPKSMFIGGLQLRIDNEGLTEYLFNRFVAGENTLYKGVKKLLPGYYMTVSTDGAISMHCWWNLASEIQNHPSIHNPLEWFRETFYDSIRLRMVSDVPVGVLLSGGLDSSSVLASLHHQGFKDIETFTIGFSHTAHNEAHLAERLSAKYGYGFNTMKVEDDLLFGLLKKVSWYNGEPLMHLNEPHLLAISQMAKAKVSVLLSGEGADELMGGYVRYKALKYPSLLPLLGAALSLGLNKIPNRLKKLRRYASLPSLESQVIYNGSNIFPKEIAEWYGINNEPINEYRHAIYKQAAEVYPNDAQRQVMFFDQHTYLCSLMDRNDRTTMGAGIECREPFLDQRLIAGLGSLHSKWFFKGKKGKFILKEAMKQQLPDEILKFRKIGLSVPWLSYIKNNPLFAAELDYMLQSDVLRFPVLEHIDVAEIVRLFKNGNDEMIQFIMPLLMLSNWWRFYNESLQEEL